VNLEEKSSNTHGGLGILEIPSSIINTFFLSILSSCFKLINSAFIISIVTSGIKAIRFDSIPFFFFFLKTFDFTRLWSCWVIKVCNREGHGSTNGGAAG
jgi:hypothetical protein